MIFWGWSWILTTLGIVGLWAAGSKKAWGWGLGIGLQILWFAYAVTTHQYGFIVSAFAYAFVYARNYLKWKNNA